MNDTGLFVVINRDTNPLKGKLSYYNFFLNGEITRLMYENKLSLHEKNKIVLFKNEESRLIPEKIVFFVNFDNNLENKLNEVKKSLKLKHVFIIN